MPCGCNTAGVMDFEAPKSGNLSDLTLTLASLILPAVYIAGGLLIGRKTKFLGKIIKKKG